MAQFSRTWWGKRFIRALEAFTDPARLGRGRSYASGGKILKFKIENGKIAANVKGSVNPYYGVYKEPIYDTSIQIKPIEAAKWSQAIKHISSKASFVAKLLMNEMPDNIEDGFTDLGLHLLPSSRQDFTTKCSCPDSANPCKHIAGVYYLVAAELDRDPFILFELRSLPRDKLQAELSKSSLGKALSSALAEKEITIKASASYYSQLEKVAVTSQINPREFWLSTRRMPQNIEVGYQTSLPAILIKKQGDFPAFWKKDGSFIEVMEELYQQVKTKNRDLM